MVEEENPNAGTVWNMDDAESQLIFGLKRKFVDCMNDWQLDEAFRTYKLILMEAFPLFKDDEKNVDIVNSDLKLLTDERVKIIEDCKVTNKEMGDYYQLLEEKYISLCCIIVDNSLYYRKKEQYRGL
jgi:hypothetical protein